jgi:hypothetical protein
VSAVPDRPGGPAAAARPGWLEAVARAGYIAKGAVYVAVGVSAMLVALGLADRANGSPGALSTIVQLPMGRALLTALTAGLLAYATLSFVAAVRAPEGGPGAKGVLLRVADGLTGALYLGLALVALRLLAEPEYRGGQAVEVYAAWVMSRPLGNFVVAAIGVGVVASSAYLLVKAYAAPLGEPFSTGELEPEHVAWVVRLGRAGTAARGAIFGLCGAPLVEAGVRDDPTQVRSVGDALTALGNRPYGPWLLGSAAAGFVAYGMYQFAKARYRRIVVTRVPPGSGPRRPARDA